MALMVDTASPHSFLVPSQGGSVQGGSSHGLQATSRSVPIMPGSPSAAVSVPTLASPQTATLVTPSSATVSRPTPTFSWTATPSLLSTQRSKNNNWLIIQLD